MGPTSFNGRLLGRQLKVITHKALAERGNGLSSSNKWLSTPNQFPALGLGFAGSNVIAFAYTSTMSDSLRRFKAEVFKALSHPTRIAIVELLRDGPLPAGKLIAKLGIEQANASQHLAVLRSKQIVLTRKEGNQVFYSLRHPVLTEVLDLMRRYFQAHIRGTLADMGEIKAGARRR